MHHFIYKLLYHMITNPSVFLLKILSIIIYTQLYSKLFQKLSHNPSVLTTQSTSKIPSRQRIHPRSNYTFSVFKLPRSQPQLYSIKPQTLINQPVNKMSLVMGNIVHHELIRARSSSSSSRRRFVSLDDYCLCILCF